VAPRPIRRYNQVESMATHPISPQREHVEPLTYEQGWELLWSLEGSMKDLFPEEGGPSGVLQQMRDDWCE